MSLIQSLAMFHLATDTVMHIMVTKGVVRTGKHFMKKQRPEKLVIAFVDKPSCSQKRNTLDTYRHYHEKAD